MCKGPNILLQANWGEELSVHPADAYHVPAMSQDCTKCQKYKDEQEGQGPAFWELPVWWTHMMSKWET